jgi:hypothetical protein
MRTTVSIGTLLAMVVPLALLSGEPARAQAPAGPEQATIGRQPNVAAPRRARPRITVVPRAQYSQYYRRCESWLAVEHRLSGDVITPQMHCWWAQR